MLPKNVPKIFRWPERCLLGKILAQDFQMAAFTKILGRRDKSVVPLLSHGKLLNPSTEPPPAKVDRMLDEDLLVGPGRQARDTLRPLAYSTLGDLVHQVKDRIDLDQVSRVIQVHLQMHFNFAILIITTGWIRFLTSAYVRTQTEKKKKKWAVPYTVYTIMPYIVEVENNEVKECTNYWRLGTYQVPAVLLILPCVCVVCVFSSHSFWTSSSLDVPAGVTQEEGHTGFLIHLLSAVRALIFLARRIQPFLSLVDREVEFCVLTI